MDFSSGFNLNPDRVNRSVQQFYELLLSQEAFFTEYLYLFTVFKFNFLLLEHSSCWYISRGRFVSYGTGESYLYAPEDFGFMKTDTPVLPDGKYVGVGASKAVRIVGDSEASPKMSVSIDGTFKSFYIWSKLPWSLHGAFMLFRLGCVFYFTLSVKRFQ